MEGIANGQSSFDPLVGLKMTGATSNAS